MARPSNADIYNREPELEEGTEAAVAAVQAQYAGGKVVEAEHKDDGSCEVTVAVQDGENYKVYEVQVDANGAITGTEERPATPPGHAKKPLKERKPHAKLKR